MIKKIISIIGLFFSAMSVTAMLLIIVLQFFTTPYSIKDFIITEGQFLAVLAGGLIVSRILISVHETKKYFGVLNVFFGSTFIFATSLFFLMTPIQFDQISTLGIASVLQLVTGFILLKLKIYK
jgi:hypothetical protein